MRADDPRHGTTAGYRAHNNSGTQACEPCRQAKNAYARSRDAGQRATRARKDFIESGYDEKDGLGEGRWMWDSWGVFRWVGSLEMPRVQTTGPRSTCLDCSTPIDRRALRCRPHAKVEADRLKREWARKTRAGVAA